MGCGFSANASSSVCRNVRVVNLNGEVEDFDYPISVGELTAKLPLHFVCTHSQLLSPCSKPLMPSACLEPGQVYFLLPFSFFQSNFSPADLVAIARKLSSRAKSNRSRIVISEDAKFPTSPAPSLASVPERFSGLDLRVEKEEHVMMQRPSKSPSWKPILPTIRERSFNRRSESDLQEKVMEILDATSHSRLAQRSRKMERL